MPKRKKQTAEPPTPLQLPLTICTLGEFASHWKVSRRQVTNWVNAGLPNIRTGARSVRIVVSEADAWVCRKWGRTRTV